MSSNNLVVKQFKRLSPSRFTAMKECLLREVWSASGNEPLLPPSPLAELGSVIHHLFEAAGRGKLEDGENARVVVTWDSLVSQAEQKMSLSTLKQRYVPLRKSILDFEVRKIRARRKAAEIAQNNFRGQASHPRQSQEPTGFEVWVESHDGKVGGYIDRVLMNKGFVVLSDYKSGAVLEWQAEESPGELKLAYKEQLKLYAALYWSNFGVWPKSLEVVPLQGEPVEVAFGPEDAECLLKEASTILDVANQRIAEVVNGQAEISSLASPAAVHCRICMFRPECQAYWSARDHKPQEKWPSDLKGFLIEASHHRNGKMSMKIAESKEPTADSFTVRNLTASSKRHPLIPNIKEGSQISIYGLKYHYRSCDYTETNNTIIFEMG